MMSLEVQESSRKGVEKGRPISELKLPVPLTPHTFAAQETLSPPDLEVGALFLVFPEIFF